MPAGADNPVYAPYVEHYPPDTQVTSLWLRNQQPKLWRDKQKIEHALASDPALEARQQTVVAALITLIGDRVRAGLRISQLRFCAIRYGLR